MKKYKIIVIILAVLLAGILLVGFIYNYEISPTSRRSVPVTVEIKENSTPYSISDELYEKGLIRNKFIYKVYVKVNGIKDIKASVFKLDKNMNLKQIMDTLEKGNSYNPNVVTLQIVEGLNVRKIAKVIGDNDKLTCSYDDIMNLMNDKEYIDTLIAKYWFLTDKIKDSKIYYPLEGYLFPETYFVDKDATAKEIVEMMLDEMGKLLDTYKDKIEASEFSVHELVTLASIVELEGASSDDRASVAGVFYNRIKDGWVLGSDVTTYYYLKIDNFKESLNGNPKLYDCDHAYNTRCTSFVGLPIGPVSNPGKESIEATINYTKHNYYYFVADCHKKTYLSKNSTEHYNTIQRLQNEGNWCA